MNARTAMILGVLLGALASRAFAQESNQPPERPLPTAAELIERVLARAKQQEALRENYTFQETRTWETLRADGSVKSRRTEIFQVFPNRNGPPSYILLAKKGKETSAEERQRSIEQDRRRRARRQHASAKDRAKEEADFIPLSRLLELYQLTLVGREPLAGRSTIKAALTPNPNARPRHFGEKAILDSAGYAWIDEAHDTFLRVETRHLRPLRRWVVTKSNFFEFKLQQQYINEEVAFPERMEVTVHAKLLGLMPYRFRLIRAFANYQRFTSEMEILDEAGPVKP